MTCIHYGSTYIPVINNFLGQLLAVSKFCTPATIQARLPTVVTPRKLAFNQHIPTLNTHRKDPASDWYRGKHTGVGYVTQFCASGGFLLLAVCNKINATAARTRAILQLLLNHTELHERLTSYYAIMIRMS
jgi:hypothetical protein